jgi:hypothetical protein
MNNEYKRKAPWLRLAIVIAAVSITLSIGGFIDLLAVSYVADAARSQPSATGSRVGEPLAATSRAYANLLHFLG